MDEQWLVVDWHHTKFYGPFESEEEAERYMNCMSGDMSETIEMTVNKFE